MRITEPQLGRLSVLCKEMENIEGPEQYKTMLEENREFHSIIIEAAASPRIAELWEQYYSLSQQYRALALELPGRFSEICAEHRRILGALKEGDKEKAENYAREHYFNTAEKIAKAFESKAEA
jgi:DNA-binding GntR family transcriptional regulator